MIDLKDLEPSEEGLNWSTNTVRFVTNYPQVAAAIIIARAIKEATSLVVQAINYNTYISEMKT